MVGVIVWRLVVEDEGGLQHVAVVDATVGNGRRIDLQVGHEIDADANETGVGQIGGLERAQFPGHVATQQPAAASILIDGTDTKSGIRALVQIAEFDEYVTTLEGLGVREQTLAPVRLEGQAPEIGDNIGVGFPERGPVDAFVGGEEIEKIVRIES